jgi:predicted nucleotidyltransferase
MSYHSNIESIIKVATALGALKDEVIFVGGATVSLYASRPEAVTIRVTDDVDIAVEVISRVAYDKLVLELLDVEFKIDKAITCRFLLDGLIVDVMPTDADILGFSNRWFKDGVKNAVEFKLDNGEVIRIFTAPYFIASKMKAFKDRGNGDLYGSHDFEDIIFVLDNNDAIEEELQQADAEVKEYLKNEFNALLKNTHIEEIVIGHVERTGQTERKNKVMQVMSGLGS